jgi:hypothetical protein
LDLFTSDEEEKRFFYLAAARQISTSTPTRMGPDHSKGGHKESSVAIIEKLLADSPVVIFSKSYCPYCAKVKNFFQATLTSNFFPSPTKPRENKLEYFSQLSHLQAPSSLPLNIVSSNFYFLFFNEADTLESSSILIYSHSKTNLK